MFAFFGASLIGMLCLAILVIVVAFWVYGIVLSIRASLILTILCLFLHVPFIIFGVVKWAFGVDLPGEIVDALSSRGSRR